MTANLLAEDVPPPCSAWLQANVLIGFKCVQRSAFSVLVDYASFELLRVEGGEIAFSIPANYGFSLLVERQRQKVVKINEIFNF